MSYNFTENTKDSITTEETALFLLLPGQKDRQQGLLSQVRRVLGFSTVGESKTKQARRPQTPGRLSTDRLKESSGTPG